MEGIDEEIVTLNIMRFENAFLSRPKYPLNDPKKIQELQLVIGMTTLAPEIINIVRSFTGVVETK